MKQRDIYYANINPSRGREQTGMRPVVIISGNAMNDNFDVCIVCPLTSSIKNYAGCVALKKDKLNNLNQDSEIITFQIRAISKNCLTKKIGEITKEQLREIITGLNEVLEY